MTTSTTHRLARRDPDLSGTRGASSEADAGAGSRPGFRRDVEGLRAFAVLSVLVYHLQPGWLPGGFAGVDVFFVISGFLITSHLAGEALRTGSVSLLRFYGRRILRLLPASTLVVVVTALATLVLAPRFVWRQFGLDTVYAGGYVLNWALADRSVNYLTADAVPSPVQHYWSLAVEEQFYLLWPLVLLVLLRPARRWSVPPGTVLGVGAALLAAVSFTLASLAVRDGAPSAYFTSTTRFWELAVGALLALVLPAVRGRLPSPLRAVLAAVSVAALVASVVLLTGRGWPSWPALLPTLAAAGLVLAGDQPTAVSRVLGHRVLVWVGGLSYSLYLWHWPVVTLAHLRWPTLDLAHSALLGATSVLLAWLTQRLVENRFRFAPGFRSRPWRPFGVAAACLVLSVGAGAVLVLAGPSRSLVAPAGAVPAGAAVLPTRIDPAHHRPWSDEVRWVLPAPQDALEDVPAAYGDGCQQGVVDSAVVSCDYGERTAGRTVALVGDSKAVQWLPALDTWGRQRGVRVVLIAKSSCPLADTLVDLEGAPYRSCREWAAEATRQLVALRPELVVTSQVRQGASVTIAGEQRATGLMAEALQRTWRALLETGTRVAVVADTPQVGHDVYACVAENPDHLDRCEYDRAEAVGRSALPAQAAAVDALGGSVLDLSSATTRRRPAPGLDLLDLTDVVCPDVRRCPPVVGNVLIYRSGSHITRTYVDSLEPRLGALLDEVLAPGHP